MYLLRIQEINYNIYTIAMTHLNKGAITKLRIKKRIP